ncbi:TPA: helix-turn-helix domain-containing protein [Vibrio diabolicus]
MARVQISKMTTWSSVCSYVIRQLRIRGVEFVRSGEDRSKISRDYDSLSQEKMAKELGITKAAYSKIENADVVINVFHISRISSEFGISTVEFMQLVENKIEALRAEGIEVKSEKIPFRLDNIRWLEKLKEKATAKYNTIIRDLKKNKSFSTYTDEQLIELKNECKQLAYNELEEKFSLEDALKEYHDSQSS